MFLKSCSSRGTKHHDLRNIRGILPAVGQMAKTFTSSFRNFFSESVLVSSALRLPGHAGDCNAEAASVSLIELDRRPDCAAWGDRGRGERHRTDGGWPPQYRDAPDLIEDGRYVFSSHVAFAPRARPSFRRGRCFIRYVSRRHARASPPRCLWSVGFARWQRELHALAPPAHVFRCCSPEHGVPSRLRRR